MDEPDIPATPRWFQLERKAMMAELRLLIVASIALNQFLSAISLPSVVVGAVTGVGLAAGWVIKFLIAAAATR